MRTYAYPVTKKTNDRTREKIESDIKAFKAAGGTINKIPTGLSGTPVTLSRKQRDYLKRTMS